MNKGNDKGKPLSSIPVQQYRLSPGQYQELEKKALSKIQFRDETGGEQAAYLVGVHEVLRLIRDGFLQA